MRCASYQENGYPAGRWRLPTTAEVLFIVDLQVKGAIQKLFVNSWYFSATHEIQYTDGSNPQIQDINRNNIINNSTNRCSVRCVYDEWYWGSEQEAQRNTTINDPNNGDYYYFTWGDKEITW